MTMTEADIWCMFALVVFIATDYVTGCAKAILADQLTSRKMRQGLWHKFAYIMLALLSYFIDMVNIHVQLGLPLSTFVCVVGGISLIELTSILENITEINPELKDAPFMRVFANTTNTQTNNDKH